MGEQPARLKTVFLYSGGMDSYIGAFLTNADVLLHVDTGTGYGDVEKEKLTTPRGMENRLRRVYLRDLAQWERPDDLILPNRNAHLVLAAGNYGNVIYLGATAGDRTNDKNEEFVGRINRLLAHLYAPQWWLPDGKEVRVELPLKPYTKRQLIEQYLQRGGDAEALSEDTFSCYHPTDEGRECGACKPCVRKWAALMANGIVPSFDAYDAVVEAREALLTDEGSRGPQELADFTDAVNNYRGRVHDEG